MKTFLLAFLILVSGFVQAQNQIVWDEAGALPIAKVQQRLKSVDVQSLNEFTEVYIDINVAVDEDQSRLKISRAYYFPDTNSIQNSGSDSINFNVGMDKLKILRIVSIAPSGDIRNFNADDLKVNDTNSYNTFSSQKTAVFTYPGLEVGGFAILEFEVVRDLKSQESDWFREFYPQNFYDRLDYRLTVNWNQKKAMQFSNKSAFVECEQQKNIVSCSGKKIPGVETDANVFWADQLDSVKFGELLNWNEVAARALDKFSISQDADKKIITSFVNELIENQKSVEEKISAIHEFVGQKIQYVSLSEHGNSYTPHSVVRTLQKRMGDCKDKTALFYSMLQVAGVQAYPVLVATERRKLEKMDLPSMTYFDHMIICFRLSNGVQACSDPTNYSGDWRYASPYIQGRIALPLIQNTKLANIPENQYRWSFKVETELTFLDDGGQSERQSRYYLNEYANYWRDILMQKNAKERQQWLIDDYKENVAEKADVKFSVNGLQDVTSPVVLTSESSHPPLVDTTDSLSYTESDAWLANELDGVKIPNKVYEYNLAGFHIISKTIWDISRLWVVKTLPAEIDLKGDFGSMVRRVSIVAEGKVEITTEVKVPRRLVPSGDIEKFNKFISLIKRESSIHLYGDLIK